MRSRDFECRGDQAKQQEGLERAQISTTVAMKTLTQHAMLDCARFVLKTRSRGVETSFEAVAGQKGGRIMKNCSVSTDVEDADIPPRPLDRV